MKIAIVGTGYVGLVAGACFAEMGNEVCCIDVDTEKIAALRDGCVPIYEPGLAEIIQANLRQGRLSFSDSFASGFSGAQICFIAVGTPPDADGFADLKNVLQVAEAIGDHLENYCVIVDKSTVPVGSAEKVAQVIADHLQNRGLELSFDVVSNPEFLKEGSAVKDFMKPDRIIIGCDSNRAEKIMRELYAPFTQNHDLLVMMGVKEAEMTKYAANAMLSTKISFMNEIANLCDRLGVDVEQVRLGIGSDARIGYSFIYPGCGYGGSCFPKDIQALIRMAQKVDFSPDILRAVERRNHAQKKYLFAKIQEHFQHELKGRRFGVWGLAFKPETDDMREAPAITLIEQLIAAGAIVQAYDPVAMELAKKMLPASWFEEKKLELAKGHYDAIEGADALILVTEWKLFRTLDLSLLSQRMKSKVIFDGRNQYKPEAIQKEGFVYYGVGRPKR